MFRTSPNDRPDSPAPRPTRAARRARPQAERLEGRIVQSVTLLPPSASPTLLRPINPQNQPTALAKQHVLPVTLSGMVATTNGAPTVSYRVIDEYGRYMPNSFNNPVVIGPGGNLVPGSVNYSYQVRFGLSIVRKPQGRIYTVVVTAFDGDVQPQSTFTQVIVPPVGFYHAGRPLRRPV